MHAKKRTPEGRTQLLTVQQVADWTGLSVRTLWAKMSARELTAIRLAGRATRLDADEVQAWIDRCRDAGRR